VIAAVGVVRTDLFGNAASSVSSRRQARKQRQARPRPAQPPKPPRPQRSRNPRSAPQQLLVTAGALAGTTLGLADQQITIGRANDATLVLNDDYASTRHARLFPQDGQWIVEDLGSTNGTYLDRQKVTQPTPVPVGVPIRIGKTVLELRR
jgi:pSer/pThr/pTyr-binding forkhead associated (FHA) protein